MSNNQRIVVTGATGQIGTATCKELIAREYAVVVFSRYPNDARTKVPGAIEYVAWHAKEDVVWRQAVDNAYAVIHLAAAPTFGKRWTKAYRKELQDSRVFGARGLVNAMAQAKVKPHVFVSASSVGAYGFKTRDTQDIDENTPPDQDEFAAEVCAAEAEMLKAETLGVRTVVLRTGYVLARDSGGLPGMAEQLRASGRGLLLPGTQYLPWIHLADEVDIILKAVEDERMRGPVNATAPHIPTNREFITTMADVLGVKVGRGMPGWMLRIFMGQVAIILTNGRRVAPKKLLTLGYAFKYPTVEQALRDLLKPSGMKTV